MTKLIKIDKLESNLPKTKVVYYTEDGIKAPVSDWIHRLSEKVKIKCARAIIRLAENGHELKRPEADILKRGIYELRIVYNNNQYRILYFFYGRTAAVLTSGFLKNQDKVPKIEIERAIKCKEKYVQNQKLHTYEEELD